ncbi:MAG: hypothetical protein IT162_19625 [Bryobacterales bacterium]|nr:hypothetical protein [Bryobacterales bacterium]
MSWFEDLAGFPETTPAAVRANLRVEGPRLHSLVNGRVLTWGRLEIPTLGELRQQASRAAAASSGQLRVREVVSGVQDLHRDEQTAGGALFQVASQFNLLEMASPNRTPEHGVGIYEDDHTQGPACAIAAGAGTIYRNYLVDVRGQTGQSAANQIDCLEELGTALGHSPQNPLWEMRNGYALASRHGLETVSGRLESAGEPDLDQFRQLLRIGWQRDTEVTLPGCSGRLVSQAYCSALPVAYCAPMPKELWRPFACLVLDAAYEATLCAAITGGYRRLYLTMLGGGVFGNEPAWILDAMERALKLYWRAADLDVVVVSYPRPNLALPGLLST